MIRSDGAAFYARSLSTFKAINQQLYGAIETEACKREPYSARQARLCTNATIRVLFFFWQLRHDWLTVCARVSTICHVFHFENGRSGVHDAEPNV